MNSPILSERIFKRKTDLFGGDYGMERVILGFYGTIAGAQRRGWS